MEYINTTTGEYPLSEYDIKAANPNTSYTVPFNPEGYAVVFATPQPAFDQYSQKCTEQPPQISTKGTWEQVWLVTDLTGEELAEAQARKAADEATQETQRVATLWQAAHDYEYAQVSGSAIGMLALGVLQNKPKCIAAQGWIASIWTEYYTRKSNGSVDYDFSFAGDIPYSVPELMQEVYGG